MWFLLNKYYFHDHSKVGENHQKIKNICVFFVCKLGHTIKYWNLKRSLQICNFYLINVVTFVGVGIVVESSLHDNVKK